MKRLKTVFAFEFNELIRRKAMLISTLVIALLFFVATFVPRIITYFDSKEVEHTLNNSGEEIYEDLQVYFDNIIVVSQDEKLQETIQSIFSGFENIEFLSDENQARVLIQNNEYDTAFVMQSITSFTVLKNDSGLDFTESVFEGVLREAIVNERLIEYGINPELVNDAQNVSIDITYETLGKDATHGLVFGFIALFALYILILLYGQLVATSVAREKDSRTMELLITSTNPKTLILGKVSAAGLVGFIQVGFIAVVILLGVLINKSTYPEFIMEYIFSGLTLDVILVYIIFSFVGYLLYLFIYAALGSLVSKVEDVSSAVTPITFIFLIAYLIASIAMSAPDSLIVRISSFVPFVSLFTMPIRYMMTSIPPIEVIFSLVLMIVTIILIGILSIYIYRKGSLSYGNRMKFTKILGQLFKKKSN